MSEPTTPYGGPDYFTQGQRQAWVRGYIWALENIHTDAVQADLKVMEEVQAIVSVPQQRRETVRPANFCPCIPTCQPKLDPFPTSEAI